MPLKSVNIDFLADSWIIIPLVQTEMTNFSLQKPAVHFPGIFQGRSYQAAVMHIGACGRHSQRNSLTVHMEMDLAATLPLSVGLRRGPQLLIFLRARRGLQQGAVHSLPLGIHVGFFPYSAKCMRKISAMTPALLQRWK